MRMFGRREIQQAVEEVTSRGMDEFLHQEPVANARSRRSCKRTGAARTGRRHSPGRSHGPGRHHKSGRSHGPGRRHKKRRHHRTGRKGRTGHHRTTGRVGGTGRRRRSRRHCTSGRHRTSGRSHAKFTREERFWHNGNMVELRLRK